MLKIATVIVTYNGEKWIEKCLNSLLGSTINMSVYVVDNASVDSTREILESFKKDITLIYSDKNLGFGGGNNLGIIRALDEGADYVFLLNQDAYVQVGCIEGLVGFAESNKNYGILSPMQLNSSGTDPDPLFKKYYKASSITDELTRDVRFVNAAAWFIPAEVFKTCGLFHSVFYHYGEDNHFCSRVQYHGYKVKILQSVSVIHDRQIETDPAKMLLQQIRTVPLYTLLDIRKSFPVAWLSGFQKLKRIRNKLYKQQVDKAVVKDAYNTQKDWFGKNIKEIIAIRRSTKNPVVAG